MQFSTEGFSLWEPVQGRNLTKNIVGCSEYCFPVSQFLGSRGYPRVEGGHFLHLL